MKIFVQEALRYTAVSVLGFALDITLLWILVHFYSWWYLTAATVSFSAGLLVGYALCVTLVFKYRRINDPRFEFAGFAAIGGIGVVVNAAAMSFGVKILGLNYLIAKCGASGCTFLWNFLARRQLLFVRRGNHPPA
jgi:putative flippase GtrA